MSYTTLIMTLLPVATGAIIGFAPALILQKRTHKHEIVTRWDAMLLSAGVDLADSARRTEHIADQIERGAADEQLMRHFDEIHQQVRVSVERIRILGSAELQLAARNVLRSVYSRRLLLQGNPDPYAQEYPGISPSDRLRQHLLVFYKAIRRQLCVSKAQEVPLTTIPAPIWQSHRLVSDIGALFGRGWYLSTLGSTFIVLSGRSPRLTHPACHTISTQPVLKDQGNPQIGSRISKDGESATVPGVRTRDTGAAPCGTKPDDASAEPDSDWPNNAD